MTLLARLAHALVWTMLALGLSACGQASLSPTSPSDVGRGASAPAGAVISGTVTGMATAMTFATESTTLATSRPVTVTVVGTNISATIDGAGRFHLNGVPAGDVQLKFTAPGLDATITLKAVQVGDRIDLKVRVTDSSVRIEAERRDRGGRDDDDDENDDHDDDENDDDDDEFKGIVSALSGSCPDITFTLNGVTVKADRDTRYGDGACAKVRNNVRVEVHGQRQADGSIRAARIELED